MFQAILPLRGKVINAEKTRVEEVLKNEEIMMIISAIGAGFGNDFDISKSNYNRIIIMTDADTDGAHIQVLLLTFFYRFMPELIEEGHVYIATPPLYKISYKNTVEYAWSDEELRNKIGNQKNVTIQRYKGLGEMNPEQLWDTTMNPKTRLLVQVTLDDVKLAERLVTTLMGDALTERKAYIQQYANFDKVDTFMDKVHVNKGDGNGKFLGL
jgi:topoisomerase-4 subunit B